MGTSTEAVFSFLEEGERVTEDFGKILREENSGEECSGAESWK
jgi:hypothetical protein